MAEDPNTGDALGGRYRLIEKIGVGGMAAVFLAEDLVLGRKVAVKRLHTDGPDAVKRFRREAQLTAGLSHPNLVAVFDAFSDEGELVVVMEYVAGSDLSKAIKAGPPDEAQGLRILSDLAAALDHVHEAGIVHRDVKPSNVLLSADGRTTKLTDLGIARVMEETGTTQTNAVPGSILYMAPEQLAGKAVGPASDIYALALVAHELLSGQPARSGGWGQISHEAQTQAPPDIRDVRAGTPPAAADVLQRGLARDPGERPDSATALIDDLSRTLRRGERRPPQATESMVPAHPPAAPPEPPTDQRVLPRAALPSAGGPGGGGKTSLRRDRRSPWRRWVVAAVAVVGAAVAAILISGGLGDGGGDGTEPTTTSSTQAEADSGGSRGASSAPVERSTEPADAPAAAVDGFYSAAAKDDFDLAAELASPSLEAQLGGVDGIAATFSTLESIDFEELTTISESASSAEVEFATTATHSDRTESCTGTASMILTGDVWLVDQLNGISCEVTG